MDKLDDIGMILTADLPVWFKMALITFVLLVGVFYLLPKIRRDKQGKIYFYSQKYEDNKRNRKQDEILRMLDDNIKADMETRKDLLQLQICASNLPNTAKRIAYHEYKKLGHNSWVDDYVVEKGLFTKEEVNFIQSECQNDKKPITQ